MTKVDMGLDWDPSMDEGLMDQEYDYDYDEEGHCTCKTGSDPRADLCDWCSREDSE